LCLAACAQASAGPQKTEVLPADGGDLGKTYVEYAKAVDTGDLAQILKFSNPELADKTADFFHAMGKLGTSQPVGGRQQGDHATVFLRTGAKSNGNDIFALSNATRGSSGWRFESPLATVLTSYSSKPYGDCAKQPEFPCGVTTAPDSIVSGTITLHKYDTFVYKGPPVFAMFDGFAVRMFDKNDKAPKSTTVFLSSMGIIPEMLTNNDTRPNSVGVKLKAPLLQLDVAADGRTAHAALLDNHTTKKTDVSQGLMIEAADGKRIRGRLKADIKDLMEFDLYFDVAVASVCHQHGSGCGEDD
jgi:hypothetical protein